MTLPKQPKEVELEIVELSDKGLGGSQHNERPVWVRNALPGEMVNAKILKRLGGQRFADGVPLSNLHQDRVRSPCAYFPRCGGCATHHLAPQAQLAHKQAQLSMQLERYDVVAGSWREPVSLLRLGYRRKARLGVRVVGESVLVGFRESFSNRVSRMDVCMTLTPELSRLLVPLKTTIAKMSDPKSVPQIELAQGDVQCALIVRHLQALTAGDMDLWRAFEKQWQVEVLMQSKGYDTLTPVAVAKKQLTLLHYQIPEYGLTLGFYPHHFTQVNAPMNRELIRTVMSYLGNRRGQVVADMYCGLGNFTLPLARTGAMAVGFEASEPAVVMGTVNAQRNGVAETSRFFVEDLYGGAGAYNEIRAKADCFGKPPQALILDPPRSGAGPNLNSWASSESVEQIVYVSCNPATFAEDAALLNDLGYALDQVGVYDMFPGTAHVETVGNFRRQ